MPRGPKGEKRPADVIGNAVKVMRIATGEEVEIIDADDGKDPKVEGLLRKPQSPQSALRVRPALGVVQRRRSAGGWLSHHHEARALKVGHKAFGDDFGGDFGRLLSRKARAARQTERKANFEIATSGTLKLVIHDLGGYKPI